MNDLGSLSGCMLENDAEARNRARRLRQKALVVSIAIEATLIAAMLLWPLNGQPVEVETFVTVNFVLDRP
jgi:hypothetical protein